MSGRAVCPSLTCLVQKLGFRAATEIAKSWQGCHQDEFTSFSQSARSLVPITASTDVLSSCSCTHTSLTHEWQVHHINIPCEDAQPRLYCRHSGQTVLKRQDLLSTYLAHHWMQSSNDMVIVAMLRHQQPTHVKSWAAPASQLGTAGSERGAAGKPDEDR